MTLKNCSVLTRIYKYFASVAVTRFFGFDEDAGNRDPISFFLERASS